MRKRLFIIHGFIGIWFDSLTFYLTHGLAGSRARGHAARLAGTGHRQSMDY